MSDSSRVDIHGTLERMGELVVRNAIEPALGMKEGQLWNNGLGQVCRTAISRSGLKDSFTVVECAEAAGLLPKENAPKRRRAKKTDVG